MTLVGGGPGTTDLLTVAAVKALRDADVVFYDRLAPYQELPALTSPSWWTWERSPGTTRWASPTSKSSWWTAPWPATTWSGSRAEIRTCSAAAARKSPPAWLPALKVQVVSGVTSAISVPAAAGIPVTHREVSHMFTVVSGHAPLTEKEHTTLPAWAAPSWC